VLFKSRAAWITSLMSPKPRVSKKPAPDNQIVQDAYLGGQGGSSRAVEERIRAKRRQILG
jgi:hypothetical protein